MTLDPTAFTSAFLTSLAANLATQVFNGLLGSLKKTFTEPEREQALRRCLKSATIAFVTSIPVDSEDEKRHLEDIFVAFFQEPDVGKAMRKLLRGQGVDREDVQDFFAEAGYRQDQLPQVNFGQSLTAFEATFLSCAAEEKALRGEIDTKVALQQLLVQAQMLAAIKELVHLMAGVKEDTLEIRDGVLTASKLNSAQTLRFSFPLVGRKPSPPWEPHYLRTLIGRIDFVDLAEIEGSRKSENEMLDPVRITEVFTTLNLAGLTRTAGEDVNRLIRKKTQDVQKLAHQKEDERTPVTAIEAIAVVDRLVVLGQPGGGKSTLVNNLASLMAQQRLGEKVDPDRLAGWAPEEGALLPVVIILRRFASAGIPDDTMKGDGGLVWNYLASDLAGMGCKEAFLELKQTLVEQGGIIFFDGLDEVSESDENKKRTIITEAIAAFAAPLKKCKIVVTCREYAYRRGDDWHLPEQSWPEVELSLFEQTQVETFVTTWYKKVGPKKGWTKEKSAGAGNNLKAAIESLPRLRELSRYPLLLTLMAQVHGDDGYLPKDRADLYERAVILLLQRWQNRLVIERDGSRRVEKSMILELGIDTEVLRLALEDVAYRAHTRQEKEKNRDERAADIPRGDLLDKLEEILGSLDKAQKVIDYIQERAGLLQADDNSIYRFPHRTFQEYLAATHVMRQSDFEMILKDAIRRDLNWWREVFLLAVATAKKSTPKNISDIVDCLFPEELSENDFSTEKARELALAGEGLVETDFRSLVKPGEAQRSDRFSATYRRAQNNLLHCLQAAQHVEPGMRAANGTVLAQLGDPRENLTTVAAMRFCLVPAGPFIMGSDTGEKSEKPKHNNKSLDYDFWISEFPVTNAQFGLFVQTEGYAHSDFWPEAQEQGYWKDNRFKGDMDDKPREGPSNFSALRNLSTHPVVGVSWFEALAFGRWLNQHYHKTGLLNGNLSINLPTEAQWEKAARGGERHPAEPVVDALPQVLNRRTSGLVKNAMPERQYPWGESPDENSANYAQTGIKETSPAGCFGHAKSPCGCQEMSGNVWEWCRTKWRSDYSTEPDESLSGNDRRVLRGGAFDYSPSNVRCAFRFRSYPDARGYYVGFRVVLAHSLGSEASGL